MLITLDTYDLSALDVDVIRLLAERTAAIALRPEDSKPEEPVEEEPVAEEPVAEEPVEEEPVEEEPVAEEPVEEEPKAEEPKKAPAKGTRRAPAKKAGEAPATVEEEPKESKADLQEAIDIAKEFMGKLGKPEAVKLALATVGAKRVSELKGDAIGEFVEELNNAR